MFFRKKNKNFNQQAVLDGCLKGHASAQKQLFEQYYGFVKSICLRYGSNTDEADEMLNDAFMKVFNKLSYYNNTHSFEAWLKTVTVRTCIDYYRKNQPKAGFVDVNEMYGLADEQESVLDKMSAEDILLLVQRLPPTYRAVFSLYVVEGYSHAEIAEQLGINEGTSRSNLAKARMKLQEWVKQEIDEITITKSHVIR